MAGPITPYLTIKGAADAIAFYSRAFDARETARLPAEDGRRLMHAAVSINGGTVMMSDEFPEHGGPPAPTPEKPTAVAVAITFASPLDVDATFHRAVAAGAKGTLAPADMFWGDRFAMLLDPFGHRWMLAARLARE